MATYTLTASQLQGANISNLFNIPDVNAQAYLTATGISDTLQQNIIAELVRDLKNYGIWSKMKAVYPFVTDNRNLLSYTEDFGNAYWSRGNIGVTTNTTTAPNGTTTADTITPSTSVSGHSIGTNLSVISGSVVVVNSIYVKANGYNYVGLSDNTTGQAVFNLSDGSIVSSDSGITAFTPENVGNGWWRISIRFTATTARGLGIDVWNNATKTSYAGNGTSGIFIWGAQLEIGSTATTYQPIATTQQAFISNQFKYNLVNPVDSDAAFRLVFNGGWTFSSSGALPNGTNGYADTKLVPSTTITRNDGSFGMYFNTTRLASNIAQGAYSTANLSIIGMYPRYTGDIFYSYINTQNGVASSTAATNTLGFRAISRTSSTNNIIQYNNNQNNATQASQGDLPLNLYIGALNLNGTATDFDSIRICFTYLSTSLSSSELSNLYTAVQAFQTKLSRQV